MAHRLPPPPPWKSKLLSVGVTGTNGKTSTTRFCATALATIARPVASTTTIGSFLDAAPFPTEKSYEGFLAVLAEAIARGGRLAALEMTSEALARGFGRMWPCEIAVFTNLTHDHLDAHGSPEHYLASKAQLFIALPEGGTAILNAADPTSELLAEVVPPHAKVQRYAVLGARREAPPEPQVPLDFEAGDVALSWEGTTMSLRSPAGRSDLPSKLSVRAVGTVFAENGLAAYAAALAAGADPRAAAEALATAPVPPGRFELVAREPHVVVDYAHTPDAIARTLEAARALCRGRLTVVFGAGGGRDRAKRAPMGAAASAADRIILTSDNPRDEDAAAIATQIRAGITAGDVVVELDRRRAIERAIRDAGRDDVVVVAGRGHEREQIVGQVSTPFSDVDVVRELTAR